ncbi:MAG: RHS repeat-associated core domain-containing protein [Bacilli bacterium]
MKDGIIIGEYVYDAWGNHEINEISIENDSDRYVLYNNPFRYKGYYYDVETNLALVSSRYYSPELGRFIQPADVSSLNPQSINGLNLYTYAVNNPIAIKYDSSVSSYGSGMVSSFMGNGVVSGGYPSSVSNAFSVKFPKQNWLSTNADFVASMAGAISVINWTSKNPQFFEFFNTITVLRNIKC